MNKEGFYAVTSQGRAGSGVGVIVLDTGMIVGADSAGIIYDGHYTLDVKNDELVCQVTCKATKAGIWLVQTGAIIPDGFSFHATARLPRELGKQRSVIVETPMGGVQVTIEKIRDFPSAS